MATVYKRNSTYWVRFQSQGREVRRSAHTSPKNTAQQFLAQLLEEHHRLGRGGRPRRTYKEALERRSYDQDTCVNHSRAIRRSVDVIERLTAST